MVLILVVVVLVVVGRQADERQSQPVVDGRRVHVADRVDSKHVAAPVRETRLLPLHTRDHRRRSYGGQPGDMSLSPLLFEVGGRNVFCPPYFLGEQILIMF